MQLTPFDQKRLVAYMKIPISSMYGNRDKINLRIIQKYQHLIKEYIFFIINDEKDQMKYYDVRMDIFHRIIQEVSDITNDLDYFDISCFNSFFIQLEKDIPNMQKRETLDLIPELKELIFQYL